MLTGTPKVRRRMKKHPLFKENVDDAVWLKNIPFPRFFFLYTPGCVASHMASDPPPPPPPRAIELLISYFKI